jgi:hypothetical protein
MKITFIFTVNKDDKSKKLDIYLNYKFIPYSEFLK